MLSPQGKLGKERNNKEKMDNKCRKTKKVGLVLAGGGSRGAYQIGFWKALKKTGLDRYVSAVSGTSVGG